MNDEKRLEKVTPASNNDRMHGASGVMVSLLATVSVLLVVKVAEAFFSTGHTVMKQASKTLIKRLE